MSRVRKPINELGVHYGRGNNMPYAATQYIKMEHGGHARDRDDHTHWHMTKGIRR